MTNLWTATQICLNEDNSVGDGSSYCVLCTYAMLCLLSHVGLFGTPWTVAHQAPLSMGILQARILEWVAISYSRGSSQPRDQTQVSHIAGGFFTV